MKADFHCRHLAGATERNEVREDIEDRLSEIRFGSDGLVPAIAQQYDTGEILMLAWMNREAVRTSLARAAPATGRGRGRSCGAKARARDRSRSCGSCALTATAMRCSCSSTSGAWPAIPAGAAVSSGRGAKGAGRF